MTLHPHLCKFHRSGLLSLNTSNGVFLPNTQVDVWFFNQMACFKALPHKDPSKLAACSIARIFSNSV